MVGSKRLRTSIPFVAMEEFRASIPHLPMMEQYSQQPSVAAEPTKQSPSKGKRISFDLLPVSSPNNDWKESNSVRWTIQRSISVLLGFFSIIWATCMTLMFIEFHSLDPLGIFWSTPMITRPNAAVALASTTKTAESESRMLRPFLSGPSLLGSSLQSARAIPLPLPKEKFSVVVMNYGRPRMIRESSMMRTLLSHPNVDEVLLLHANPKTAFEFVHPKVVNIDATAQNEEMGLSLRFYFCQLAKNEWVLHIDDDMEFTTAALNELLIEYSRNPKRIVGRYGRNLAPSDNSFNGYSSTSTHRATEVVLTKFMAMERGLCSAFFDYAHLLYDIVLQDGEGPLWNGEDIFMSLVANHLYRSTSTDASFNNYAMDWLDVWQASDALKDYDNGKMDISGGMKGLRFWSWQWWDSVLRRNRHYSYRGSLWKTAKKRLAGLANVGKIRRAQTVTAAQPAVVA
jgi:hypothetical protein